MKFHHETVLLEETIEALQVQPGGRYIDCTLGEGGHAAAILARSSPGGQLLGIDADPEAIEAAGSKLQEYGGSMLLINGNFSHLGEICTRHGFSPVQGILFDLGISSRQLASTERGFSFQADAPLDMRFSPDQSLTAAEIINKFPENEIAAIIRRYGEEPGSRRIARFIVENRPVETTTDLARIISRAIGHQKTRIHPATRTFQALRMAVNREIDNLKSALHQTIEILGEGGRLAVISFHSLEDRAAKEFISRESRQCLCPPEAMICDCGHQPVLKAINKKVIRPGAREIKANPRSRSARLRIAERIPSN